MQRFPNITCFLTNPCRLILGCSYLVATRKWFSRSLCRHLRSLEQTLDTRNFKHRLSLDTPLSLSPLSCCISQRETLRHTAVKMQNVVQRTSSVQRDLLFLLALSGHDFIAESIVRFDGSMMALHKLGVLHGRCIS